MTSTFEPVLQRACGHALQYLKNLVHAPVGVTASLAELRHRLCHPLPNSGMDASKVIDDLVKQVSGGIMGNTSGRFFGWVVGGTLPAALAADWLTTIWNQNAALFACAPAEAVIEELCGTWLKELLGMPSSASFALVSGCQMAHVTCLAAACHAVLARQCWDVEREGLHGAPRILIISTTERHGSIDRALRFPN